MPVYTIELADGRKARIEADDPQSALKAASEIPLRQARPQSRPEAAARNFFDLYLAGMDDELSGAEASARARYGQNPLWSVGRPVFEGMEFVRRLNRGEVAPGARVSAYDAAGDKAERDTQEALKSAREQHPVSSVLGGVAGGIGQAATISRLPAMRMAGSALRPQNFARAAATGSGAAAAYEFGSADNQDVASRLTDVPAAAATGGTVGVLSQFATPVVAGVAVRGARGVGDVVRSVYNRSQLTPAERAVRLIDRAITRGGAQPQDLVTRAAALGRQGGPLVESIAEVGGTGTQGLGRAVNTVTGPGQDVARDFLGRRREGMAERVVTAIRRATGRNPANAGQLMRSIEAGRRAQARPLYQQGYSTVLPPDAGARLAQFVTGQTGEEAARIARRIAESAARASRDPVEIVDARAAMQIIDEAVAGNQVQWTPRALDYLQRGYRDIADQMTRSGSNQLALGVRAVRDEILDVIEREVPALRQAQRIWAEGANAREALDTGRTLLNRPAYEIQDILANASQVERDALIMGLAETLARRVNANDSAAVNSFLRDRNVQNALSLAFDDQRAFRQFMVRLTREQGMQRTANKMLAQSETTDKAQEVFDATNGEQELSFIADMLQSGTPIRNAFLRLAGEAWERARQPGVRNPEVHREVAIRLWQRATRGNAQNLANEIAALRARRDMQWSFTRPVGDAPVRVAEGLLPYVATQNTQSSLPERE